MTIRRFKLIKGGLSDGTLLADLNDVASTAPTNGDLLMWNGTEWVPSARGANPSVSVGTAVVNGTALTYLRSDAAPALDPGIVPTWTGTHTWTDNDKVVLGTGLDLSLYHDGTNSFIESLNGTATTAYLAYNRLFYSTAALRAQYETYIKPTATTDHTVEGDFRIVRSNSPMVQGFCWSSAPLSGAPGVISNGDVLIVLTGGGWASTTSFTSASIRIAATETWADSGGTPTALGSKIEFRTCANGGAVGTLGFSMQSHLQVLLDNSEVQIGAGTDLRLYHDGTNSKIVNATGTLDITSAGTITVDKPLRLKGYTVATLPAGTQGDRAFVTDALAPAFLVAVVGGGAVVAPVFYNGAAWVA